MKIVSGPTKQGLELALQHQGECTVQFIVEKVRGDPTTRIHLDVCIETLKPNGSNHLVSGTGKTELEGCSVSCEIQGYNPEAGKGGSIIIKEK